MGGLSECEEDGSGGGSGSEIDSLLDSSSGSITLCEAVSEGGLQLEREDKGVQVDLGKLHRVSVWVGGTGPVPPLTPGTAPDPSSALTIAGQERVTMRITAGRHSERRLSDATLYEDIEEAADYFTEECWLPVPPPPLPPRQPRPPARHPAPLQLRRKNLCHHLGLGEGREVRYGTESTLRNLQEAGRIRSRKDLTKFLGIHEVRLRRRGAGARGQGGEQRRSRRILDNLLGASRAEGRAGRPDRDTEADRAGDKGVGQKNLIGWEQQNCQKCRTSSFSSQASSSSKSSSSSSSYESLAESSTIRRPHSPPSSLSRLLRRSHRRFSTTGLELVQSLRRKSVSKKQQYRVKREQEAGQGSLQNLPLSTGLYQEQEQVEELRVLPLLPALASQPETPSPACTTDSLETLIRLAQGELRGDSSPARQEEPVYIEMSGLLQSAPPPPARSSRPRPNYNEYMDMEVVQTSLLHLHLPNQ